MGRQWALWAGTALVFVAVAWILAMSWRSIGAGGQLAFGALIGVALLAGGEWSRKKVEMGFSAGLAGGGLAVLYLDAWAAMARYHVLDFNQTLPLMVGVAVLGVFMALRYDAISLSVLATVGGFLTPALLGGGSGGGNGSVVPFLSYVAVLNAGILAISLFKRWRILTWLAFVSTVILVLGWAFDANLAANRWTVFTYLTTYFLLFVGAASYNSLRLGEGTEQEDILLIVAAAAAYFGAGYALITAALGGFPAAFPLGLAVAFGLFALLSWVVAADNKTLPQTGIGLAAVFTTLAIPIQLRQGWVAIGWSMEAAVLLTLAILFGGLVLRRAGQIVWLLSLLSVLSVALAPRPVDGRLFFNAGAFPLLISVLSTGWVLAFLHRRNDMKNDELSGLYAVVSVLGGAMLLGREVMFGFANGLIPWPAAWQGADLYVVSVVLALYAAAMFSAGLWLRDIVVRSCALAVAAVAAVVPMWTSAIPSTTVWTPIWNPRWLAFAITAAIASLLAWMASRENEALEDQETEVAGRLPVVMHVLVLWGLTVEVIRSLAAYPSSVAALAPVAVGALWCLYGAFLLTIGFGRRDTALRTLAYLAGGGGALLLFGFGTATAWAFAPFGNGRFSSFVLAAGAAAVAARLTRRQAQAGGHPDADMASVAAAAVSALLILWGASIETYVAAYRSVLAVASGAAVALTAVAMVWSVACMAFVAAGRSWRRSELCFIGYAAGTIGALMLLTPSLSFPPQITPVLNIRFAAFALAVTALLVAAWIGNAPRAGADSNVETEAGLARLAQAGAALVAVWGICVEVYHAYAYTSYRTGVDGGDAALLAVSIVCALSAVALSAIGWRAERPDLRWIGYAALVVGVVLLANQAVATLGMPMRPVLNVRATAFAAAVAAMAVLVAMFRQQPDDADPSEEVLPDILMPAALMVGFWAVTQETHSAFLFYRDVLGYAWDRWAQSGISLAWTVFAAGLWIGGALRHSRTTRWAALGLFGVTILKVMVLDLASLDLQYRILSTAVLGLVLIGISWFYSRYGVGRDEDQPAPKPDSPPVAGSHG